MRADTNKHAENQTSSKHANKQTNKQTRTISTLTARTFQQPGASDPAVKLGEDETAYFGVISSLLA